MSIPLTKRRLLSLLPATMLPIAGCSQISRRLSGSYQESNGDTKWLTELQSYLPIFIEQLDDERYLTGGTYYPSDGGESQPWYGVLDGEGELKFKTIDEDRTGSWLSGTKISDGGFALAGAMRTVLDEGNGVRYSDYLARYDENGEEIWQKSVRGISPEGDNTAEAIEETREGNLVFVGVNQHETIDVTKLSSDGRKKWNKSVYRGTSDPPADVESLQLEGGNSIIGLNGSQSVILALNPDGEQLWRRTVGTGASDIAMIDNEIVLTDPEREANETIVRRMQTDGTEVWKQTLEKYYLAPISTYGETGISVIASAGKRIWVGTFSDEGKITGDAIYGDPTSEDKIIADTVVQQNGDHVACGNMQEGDGIEGWWTRIKSPE